MVECDAFSYKRAHWTARDEARTLEAAR